MSPYTSRATAILLVLAVLALLAVLWLLAVRWLFRLRQPPAKKTYATCPDGWRIAIFFRPAARRKFREPVLLSHGLAANHLAMDLDPPYSLAHHLNTAGFDCYMMDWRGTGHSRRPAPGKRFGGYTIDDHIQLDAPTVIDAILERSGAKQVFWVGHSLGGLIGYGAAQGPRGRALRGLVTIGSPVFFRYEPRLQLAARLGPVMAWPLLFRQRLVSIALAPFLGYLRLPLSDVLVNIRHISPLVHRVVLAHAVASISRGVLLQFRDWILNDSFRSIDGSVDYREGLAKLELPLLMLAGSQDRLAPAKDVETAYQKATTPDKTLIVVGRDRGDKEEYGHIDLVLGTGAPLEVYPAIQTWLEARATTMN